MTIFNHRLRWYLTKYAKFKYRIGRGNTLGDFFYGKVKTLLYGIMTLGTSEIVSQGWWDFSILQHIPWWVLVLIPILETIKDYYLGLLDEKKLNLWQIENEITLRKKISPWETEKMDRIKNIEKKIAPENYKENHKTYMEE